MAGPPKVNPITGTFYCLSVVFFMLGTLFGWAFIGTSRSANFFTWMNTDCTVEGPLLSDSDGKIFTFDVDMKAKIGWQEFTISLDSGAAGCFEEFTSGKSYSLADYDDNNALVAGYGMAASWAIATLVGAFTVISMLMAAMCTFKLCLSMRFLATLWWILTLGLITATSVFWWMVEGKFGDREAALTYNLLPYVLEAAENCNTQDVDVCADMDWEMDAPGWALSLGITAIAFYGTGTFLLYMRAPRTDALLNGADEPDPETDLVKHVVADRVVSAYTQPDDKARGKERRSARTGVRAGTLAPSATVSEEGPHGEHADPMSYALGEGGDEGGSQDEAEDEVVYQNHQVHPSIVNHSMPNQTQPHSDETMSSRQSEAMSRVSPAQITAGPRARQYSRGYSRGTSGASYTTGGHSFEAPSDADFSDTASSAQYYGQDQGGSRSFMSVGSRGDSFDDYVQR